MVMELDVGTVVEMVVEHSNFEIVTSDELFCRIISFSMLSVALELSIVLLDNSEVIEDISVKF